MEIIFSDYHGKEKNEEKMASQNRETNTEIVSTKYCLFLLLSQIIIPVYNEVTT